MNKNLEGENETRKSFPGPNNLRKQQYKFSEEEIKAIRDCNRESFYRRCLPLSAVFGFGTYFGVKNGYLKPNSRFGAGPKVSLAVIIGYFIGKFSYQTKCAEKLMQLPNSQIGAMLRQRRSGGGGRFQESIDPGFGPGMSLAPFGSVSESDVYSDLNPNSSLDIDTSRPENPGLDDYQRPSVDNPNLTEEEMPPEQLHVTSYEELRKKNREEYQQKRIGNYKEPYRPNPTIEPEMYNRSRSSDFNSEPSADGKTKYGDSWG